MARSATRTGRSGLKPDPTSGRSLDHGIPSRGTPMGTYKRRKKLINPRLQLWLVSIFVGLSALSLLLQFVLFQDRVSSLALELPNDSARMFEVGTRMTLEVLAASFLVFLPLTFLVGVLTTFRIAGPLYRFEMFLRSVQRGENPPDFRLRSGDKLHEFAELLNEVTRPLRTGAPEGSAMADPAARAEPAAPLPSEDAASPSDPRPHRRS